MKNEQDYLKGLNRAMLGVLSTDRAIAVLLSLPGSIIREQNAITNRSDVFIAGDFFLVLIRTINCCLSRTFSAMIDFTPPGFRRPSSLEEISIKIMRKHFIGSILSDIFQFASLPKKSILCY